MKTLFAIIFSVLSLAGASDSAFARPIVIFDVTIPIETPDGYVDASIERNLPSDNALFVTEAVEPWEEAGEVSEGIFFYGLGLKPSSEAIKQQKFEDIFNIVRERIAAKIAERPFKMPEAAIDSELINAIYGISYGKNAHALEVTDDREDRKAMLIDTGFVMPGVVTYPILEEISFARVKDRIVIFHATRVDTGKLEEGHQFDKDVRVTLKSTGTEVRNGLVSAE